MGSVPDIQDRLGVDTDAYWNDRLQASLILAAFGLFFGVIVNLVGAYLASSRDAGKRARPNIRFCCTARETRDQAASRAGRATMPRSARHGPMPPRKSTSDLVRGLATKEVKVSQRAECDTLAVRICSVRSPSLVIVSSPHSVATMNKVCPPVVPPSSSDLRKHRSG